MVGGGKISFSHGEFDVPAPAAKIILEKYNIPFAKGPVLSELATPTGISIISVITSGYIERKTFILPKNCKIGYGKGSKEFKDIENKLTVYMDNITE